MADEEGMTPRERRAARSRSRPAGNAPKREGGGVRWKTVKPLIIIGLIVAVVIGAIVFFRSAQQECPDHWHATQAVFVPAGSEDAAGFDTPKRLDWASPVGASGRPYYDMSGSAKMGGAFHMHQSGSTPGADPLGESQLHLEGGKCIGVQRMYGIIDLVVGEGSVEVPANAPLASVPANQGGPWNDNGEQRLRFFLESASSPGRWAWSERDIGDYFNYQLQDGEAVMLAFGKYSDQQLQGMMDQVPYPSSRSPADLRDPFYQPAAGTTTSSTTTAATNATTSA